MAMAGSATILVIDDDSAMRTIVSLSLKRFGHLVLVAGSGEFTFVPCSRAWRRRGPDAGTVSLGDL